MREGLQPRANGRHAVGCICLFCADGLAHLRSLAESQRYNQYTRASLWDQRAIFTVHVFTLNVFASLRRGSPSL